MSKYFQHHDVEDRGENDWRADSVLDALSPDDRAHACAALAAAFAWVERTGGCPLGYYLDRVVLVREAVGEAAFNAAQREAWRREALHTALDAERDTIRREREAVELIIDLSAMLEVYAKGKDNHETRGQALSCIRDARQWIEEGN